MSNLHLVTGYAGAAHITPEDHGSLYAAIFGNGSYVLDRGNKLAASAITSNQIRVLDGDMVIQGRHVRLAANSHVDLTIENGAQGAYRNDLIVARYTKNGSTGVEECNLVVIKGAATASDPQDPEHITGDILGGGATQHDFPLYRVPLNGLAVGELVPLFTVAYLVTLGSNGKVPADYLPAMNYIPTSQKGAASGVAPLNASKKIDSSYLPSMNYIPTSQKGTANGVAKLDANSCLANDLPATEKIATVEYGNCMYGTAGNQWTRIISYGRMKTVHAVYSGLEARANASQLTLSIKDLAQTSGTMRVPEYTVVLDMYYGSGSGELSPCKIKATASINTDGYKIRLTLEDGSSFKMGYQYYIGFSHTFIL